MIALGNNAHIFARPQRRPELFWCFETVLACGPVATVVSTRGFRSPCWWSAFPAAAI